ncbi:hypothetical protein P3X46_023938 [Hevea brasiliensis]|uniref:Armadillo repeat-containing protein 8 n=1 Tax=Hevea brasiliensis TaxID=3981 RepID=A0ABQ9LEF5_HEVBR|nr:uncharacterized protein LOC110633821 [Hevea brasiliensis]KAJ9164349.1 hypothetical protein P3X46_023938 [Hevea brasiliensis]
MPTASAALAHRPMDLLNRLASPDPDIKLKALREIKNQIIGNRTKKLAFLKLGAIPTVASILAEADSQLAQGDVSIADKNSNHYNYNIIIQSAAVLGSFACGFDAGVRAVLDAGAFPYLVRLLSNPDEKVVDASARSIRMIYQSKLTPKYEFLKDKKMEFLISLLNSESENVTGLGASIITHSCETSLEQTSLCDAGVLHKLLSLLDGSLCQRDASLESLAALFRNNPEVISKFVGPESGRALGSIMGLTKDRNPRTRLLSCMCLIVIRNSSSCYLQDIGIKTKLVHLLLELLDDPGQVGDEAPFVFSSLIMEKEDLQKLAFEANALDKFSNHLQNFRLHPKRFQGILLALADICSKLESCRSRFLSLQVLNLVIDALTHDSADVRTAACICIRSVTRSIKNLCAGYFMNEVLVIPLVQLLNDPLASVQVAALGALSNILVDFTTGKSTFVQCGGVKQLIQLSKSMDSTVRLNALWALKNMVFLADDRCKEGIFMELTASLLASLICDHDPFVQEQALAFVRNLIEGSISSVEFVFTESGIILDAVRKQLENTSKAEVGIQGMYVLCNLASGNEFHKEAVMQQLLSQVDNETQSFIIKFLQSNDSRLRTAAVWAIVNLTFPSSPGAFCRLVKLRSAGIVPQIRNMVNDPCLDVKLRVRTVLGQAMTFGDGLS